MPSSQKQRDMREAKYRALAAALAKGMPPEAAMLEAGYAAGTAKGKQIRWTGPKGENVKGHPAEHPVVARYIAELQAEARKEVGVTIKSITDELEEAREVAKGGLNAGAMVQASMGKAKLHGLIVNKSQALKPVDAMTEDELDQLLQGKSDDEVIAWLRTRGVEVNAGGNGSLH